MKAWRVHEYGPFQDCLRWEEAPDPVAPAGGVVIEVSAAGINFPDLLAIAGTYQVRSPLPFIPGLEACGRVVEVGEGATFELGDRVMINAQRGAYAERMAAAPGSIFAVPPSLSDEEAAAFIITHQTSYYALVDRAGLRSGEVVLVHGGAGGVGTSAIQIAKALGARVIATATGEAKQEVCRRAGADHALDSRSPDLAQRVLEWTEGRGADVIYDPVGGQLTHLSTKCIAFDGRLLIIGFASGAIPEMAANRILLKNISVVGVHWGALVGRNPERVAAIHQALSEMVEVGGVRPILWRELRMAELPQALSALQGRDSYGKIVVRN